MHFLDRVRPAALRPIAVGRGVEIRLEDRLQHQLGGGLHHAVPDRRDTERPLAATGLRDHHPSHRCGSVRLRDQILPDRREPLLPAGRFDHGEGDPVDARRALVGARQIVGVAKNVFATDLVVEQVEAERRLVLRLEIELPLKLPDAFGCCQAHRQSPILNFVASAPEVRALPSAGVTRPRRYYDPVRTPASTAAQGGVEGATLVPGGPPQMTRVTLPACRAHYPGGPQRVRLSVASPPRAAFPVSQPGRRPRLHFRGLLRLHSHYGPSDRSAALGGLCHEASTRPVAQTSRSSATRSTDNSLGGTFLHW